MKTKMSCTEAEQSSSQFSKYFQNFRDSKRVIVGLVTTTEDRTSVELNCFLCSNAFDDIILFSLHINSKHSTLQRKRELFPKPDDGVYYVQNDDISALEFEISVNDKIGHTIVLKEETDTSAANQDEDSESKGSKMITSILDSPVKEEQTIGEQEMEMPTFELVKVVSEFDADTNIQRIESKNPSKKEEMARIDFLIKAYKEYPVFWDPRIPGHKKLSVKTEFYDKIAKAMSEKFRCTLTAKQVQAKLHRILQLYQKEVRTMITNKKEKSRLWYFDKLSFFNFDTVPKKKKSATDPCEKNLVIHPSVCPASPDAKSEKNHNSEIVVPENGDGLSIVKATDKNSDETVVSNNLQKDPEQELDTKNTATMLRSKKLSNKEYKERLDFLIDTYKAHPVLWDPQIRGYKNSLVKNRIYIKIAESISKKFNCSQTVRQIRRKLNRLRETYREEVRKMIANKSTKSSLWYFDKLSFANFGPVTKKEKQEIVRKRKKTIHNRDICEQYFSAPISNDASADGNYENSEPDFDENIRSTSNAQGTDMTSSQPVTRRTKNLYLFLQFKDDVDSNSYFIDLYKNCPCLWDAHHSDNINPEKKREACKFLLKSMKDKWNIELSEKLLQQKISLMHLLFEEEQQKDPNESKPWYYNKLIFLKETSNPQVNTNNDYTCEFCEDLFTNDSALKRHLGVVHKIRCYTCKICGAKFTDKGNCSVHERRHTKTYPHPCTVCQKRFVTSVELSGHMRVHTGEKPFVCDECGAAFRVSCSLLIHKRRHRNEKIFKCTVCPKTFTTSKSAKNHIETHSDNRNYKCNVCGKGFKVSNSLRQHLLLHSEEKKYACKICGQSFSQHAGLHGHMKTNHDIAQTEV